MLFGQDQTATLLAQPLAERGSATRIMTAQALMDFGRCPWRWVHSPDPEDWLAAEGPTLLEWVALDTGQAARFFIRRPETYEAMILQCPRCGSPGPAKSCTKCGTLRRNVVKPRPWSNAAKYCSKWTQKREEQALKIIPAAEWDRAAGQTATLLLDEAVKAFIPSCDRLRLIHAKWTDQASQAQITLRARISLVPIHEDADQVALGQVVEARNADPAVWESSAWASGAHIRAALALDLWNSLNYVECKEFLWLVVEHDQPYLVARRRASPELLAEGRARYRELLAAYLLCLEHNSWPRFEAEAHTGINSWTPVWMQPWMTTSAGPHGGYFAPTILYQQAAPPPANAPAA